MEELNKTDMMCVSPFTLLSCAHIVPVSWSINSAFMYWHGNEIFSPYQFRKAKVRHVGMTGLALYILYNHTKAVYSTCAWASCVLVLPWLHSWMDSSYYVRVSAIIRHSYSVVCSSIVWSYSAVHYASQYRNMLWIACACIWYNHLGQLWKICCPGCRWIVCYALAFYTLWFIYMFPPPVAQPDTLYMAVCTFSVAGITYPDSR